MAAHDSGPWWFATPSHVRLLHPLFHAGLSRRTLRITAQIQSEAHLPRPNHGENVVMYEVPPGNRCNHTTTNVPRDTRNLSDMIDGLYTSSPTADFRCAMAADLERIYACPPHANITHKNTRLKESQAQPLDRRRSVTTTRTGYAAFARREQAF